MSYILDALKKSEAERSSKDHPEFDHRVPFDSAPRKQREIWPYLLMLALVANALVIGYVMWPDSTADNVAVGSGELAPVQRQQPMEQETAKTSPQPPVEEEAEASEAEPPKVVEDSPSETSGGPSSQTDSAEAPRQEEPVVSRAPPPEPTEEVPDINAMPRSVQQRVPEMSFNGHVYSSSPSSRRVMINNQMLREGDRVGALVIEEITPPGVVFRLDEHVFQIGVVRDWQGAL